MLKIDFQKPNFFSESGPGKHFQDSGIRAIDSPHKITPYGSFLEKNFPVKIHVKKPENYGTTQHIRNSHALPESGKMY